VGQCGFFGGFFAGGASIPGGASPQSGTSRVSPSRKADLCAIAPMAVPLVLAATNNNWSINMCLFALSYFLGAICWAFINSDERLHE
jgi:uncharacterized membrane protein YqaE (UPF0057 family)